MLLLLQNRETICRNNHNSRLPLASITCSKLTIETLEQGHRTATPSFWSLYYQLWTYLTSGSSISVANFENVIIGWVHCPQVML